MRTSIVLRLCVALAAPLLAAACTQASAAYPAAGASAAPAQESGPHVRAPDDVSAGRYLVIVGGCNDCHTQRWGETNGQLPEAQWLTGNPVGYHGPWGTSYAANLRGLVQRVPEDRWVQILKTAAGGHGRPPMPWMNTARMADTDLRNLYRYIHSLGPAGERMPRGVPPGQQPTTPYVDFTPRQPAANAPAAPPAP